MVGKPKNTWLENVEVVMAELEIFREDIHEEMDTECPTLSEMDYKL